jgi:hypothetical protein
MSTNAIQQILTLPTTTNFSSLQYTAVQINSSGLAVAATAGDGALGFIQNTPDGSTDTSAAVAVSGKTKAQIGTGGVTAGGYCDVGSSGTLVAHASGVVVAQALETGSAGDVVSVLIISNA